jgi:hypothetical protein
VLISGDELLWVDCDSHMDRSVYTSRMADDVEDHLRFEPDIVFGSLQPEVLSYKDCYLFHKVPHRVHV